jgi:hypothetical protein
MRAAYLAAVVARYRVLDLTALTPDTDEDHVPILLRQVFVPQRVRADPPPVELPRDLLRRLVEAGELTGDELPAEFDQHDRELLAKVRDAHTAETPRPVAELLGDPRHRHVVLLGDPGAGKSSLLRYVALSLAGEAVPPELAALAGHLPVVVELRAYASQGWRTGRWSDGTLLDFLDYLYTQQGMGLPADALEAYLRPTAERS